ncbi:DUF6161 domain-containing protein [Aquimarina rhabdastrellae]
MTTDEVRKKIVESKNSEWFKSVEIVIKYSNIEFEQKLIGFSSIHKFFSDQVIGWNEYSNIPRELNVSKRYFSDCKNRLDNFLNSYLIEEEFVISNNWESWKRFLNNKNDLIFTYESPFTKFLIELKEKIPNAVNSAFNYFVKTNINFSSRESIIGVLLAYEFDFKEKSILFQRTKKERTSLNRLKNDYKNQISQSEIDRINFVDKSKDELNKKSEQWDYFRSEKDNQFKEWFDGGENNIGIKSVFENFKKNKEQVFNEWMNGDNTDENIGVKKEIENLKETYKELLKLKEPANYWKDRSQSLKNQGWFFVSILIALVLIVTLSLIQLLWNAPEQIYASFFAKDKSGAIRWSIIYITFISFMAFCIKAITKVMFSSFHLARDSQERHTLTYFYLSLLNESNIEKEDRQLIMQSLFSRADTGLLKDDSGPTMPNDIAGKIFGGK